MPVRGDFHTAYNQGIPDIRFEYGYNAFGDRLQTTAIDPATGTTIDSTQYLLDINSSLTQVLGEFSGADNSYYLLGWDVIGQQTNGNWSYFQYDALGSVRQITDSTATVTYAANYTPYGIPFETYGAGSALGFAGEYTDATDLIYLRARYMDPLTGSFLTRDPVWGVPGGMSIRYNPYTYANSNPMTYIDPSGRFGILASMGLGALIGGGVDLGGQMYNNYRNGRDLFYNIDGCSVLRSAVAGAIGGYFGAAFAGHGLIFETIVGFMADLAFETVMDWAAGGLTREAFKQNVIEASIGAIIGMGFDIGLDALGKGIGNALGGINFRGMDIDAPGNVCKANSFSAETEVSTSEGDVPISEIEVGDTVLAYNEETGEVGEYTVTDTISHVDEDIIHLTIDGELIETTAEHPFYTDDGEWVNAVDLTEGELILSLDGDYGTVEAVILVEDANQAMYNLTVDEAHTFSVGEGNWVVHNIECVRFLTPDRADAYNPSLESTSAQFNVRSLQIAPDMYNRLFAGTDLYVRVQDLNGNDRVLGLDVARELGLRSYGGVLWDPDDFQTLVDLHAMGDLVSRNDLNRQSSPFLSLSDNWRGLISTGDPTVRNLIDNLATHIDLFNIPDNRLYRPTIGPGVGEGEVLFFGFGLSDYGILPKPISNFLRG